MITVFAVGCAAMGASEGQPETIAVDFENGELDVVRPTMGARWAVEDGWLVHADRFMNGGVAMVGDTSWANPTVELDVRLPELYWERATNWVGVGFNARGLHWSDSTLVKLRFDGTVEVLDGWPQRSLVTTKTEMRPNEQTVRIRLEVEGTQCRVFLNGDEVLSFEHTTYASGMILVGHFGNEAAFDNITVTGTQVPRTLGRKSPKRMSVTPVQPTPVKHEPVQPLPRIGVKVEPGVPGTFIYADSGEPFHPRGFNQAIIDAGWHGAFDVGVYDGEKMDAMLKQMKSLDANVVRMWAWGNQREQGFTGAMDARGLNGTYMENFVDFLRRATRHGLYVIPILDEIPHNAYYHSVADRNAVKEEAAPVLYYNEQFLMTKWIAAKAQAIRDFIGYVKKSDPNLLPSVLGWSLSNEIFATGSHAPFMYDAGIYTTATGKRYDMADKAQRQACWDDSILLWANRLTEAVKDVDPDALVNAGMWTADAQNRPAVNYLLPDDNDPRYPPRPSVLGSADCKLDFIDVHIYPWGDKTKVRREVHERDQVIAAGTPAIVGEYGTFKHQGDTTEAKPMLKLMLDQAYDMGYAGDLFWVWDMTEVDHPCWSAVEDGLGAYVMGLDFTE